MSTKYDPLILRDNIDRLNYQLQALDARLNEYIKAFQNIYETLSNFTTLSDFQEFRNDFQLQLNQFNSQLAKVTQEVDNILDQTYSD